MKFREIHNLSDEEIKYIVGLIVIPNKIKNITRYRDDLGIEVIVEMKWYDEEYGLDIFEDCINLNYNSIYSENTYNHNQSIDDLIYRKWLLSKGCNLLLKDNKWIK